MKVFDNLLKLFGVVFVSLTLYLFLAHWLPMDFILYSLDDNYNEKTGWIGDTIGGILSPLIAVIASILTYLAFNVQTKANKQQRNDIAIERFESKFYKLLEFHNTYSSDLKLGNNEGKRVFIALYNELKLLNYIVDNLYHGHKNETEIFEISYQLFFYGTSNNHRVLLGDLNSKLNEDSLIAEIERFKILSRADNNGNRTQRIIVENVNRNPNSFNRLPTYTYFDGHLVRLSHYYRNLYQIVNLVDKAKCFDGKNEYENKYHYLSILRAQMSVYEQALLYFNACSILGKSWGINEVGNKNLISKYCLIRSLPLPFANYYIEPLNKLGRENEKNGIRYNYNGKALFEWEEIRGRVSEVIN